MQAAKPLSIDSFIKFFPNEENAVNFFEQQIGRETPIYPLMGKFKPNGETHCTEFNFSKNESREYLQFE